MIRGNLMSSIVGGRGEPDPKPPAPPASPFNFGGALLSQTMPWMPAAALAGAAAPAPPAPPAGVPAPPPEPPAGMPVMAVASPVLTAAALNTTALNTTLLNRIRPEILTTLLTPQNKTTTQLARGAVTLLRNAAPAVVNMAINSATSRDVRGDALMPYLERKVRVGEVLNDLAARWSDTTKADFADAFNMPRDQLDSMDALVSLAILSDKDLEAELRAENTTPPTPADLLENRRIVWQSVAAGTPWQPPYLMVVAVDYQNTAAAEDVLQSIVADLVWTRGFRMPRSVSDRLSQ